jgi:hypothetical protein
VAFDDAGRAATNASVSITAIVAMRLVNFFMCTFLSHPISGSDSRIWNSAQEVKHNPHELLLRDWIAEPRQQAFDDSML